MISRNSKVLLVVRSTEVAIQLSQHFKEVDIGVMGEFFSGRRYDAVFNAVHPQNDLERDFVNTRLRTLWSPGGYYADIW